MLLHFHRNSCKLIILALMRCCILNCSHVPKTGLQSKKSNFIADRPKAALLFWFFGDFRCGGLLFMVVVVVAFLFYVHDKHLRSCRDGQLT